MTAYVAAFSFTVSASAPTGTLALHVNSTYPARVAKIEFFSGIAGYCSLTHNSGGTLSGGSSITPLPLRGGALASTETVKSGASVAGGTNTLITYIAAGQVEYGSTGVAAGIPGSTSYTLPFDYIVTSGNSLTLNMTAQPGPTNGTVNVALAIYFEELHLTGNL